MKSTLCAICICIASVLQAQTPETTIGGGPGPSYTIIGTPIAEDIPLPNFIPVDGSALQLPQGVNPLVYLSQSITKTVYVADGTHGCPTNPTGGGTSPGQGCDYSNNDFTGLNAVMSAWANDGNPASRWDVVITHESHFDSSTAWVWLYKSATGFIVFHSDCTAPGSPNGMPCVPPFTTQTNDLGYNPSGRQVCSHGNQDPGLNPPLPNMGYRNHGCTGAVLGFPSTASAIPVTTAAYPLTNLATYNDLANMFTLSTYDNGVVTPSICSTAPTSYPGYCCPSGSTVTACLNKKGQSIGAVIQMGWGEIDSSSGTSCYGGPCPLDGINHIVLIDAQVKPDPAAYSTYPIDVTALEWAANGNPLPLDYQFAKAAPHDIVFMQDYFTSDADDDGLGVNETVSMVRLGCAGCALNHNYIDGQKYDGTEGHAFSVAPPGPYQLSDNWCEGNSICFFSGGATPPYCVDSSETPTVPCDNPVLTQNIERSRNRVTYNPRWLPSPAGITPDFAGAVSWTCVDGTLVMTSKTDFKAATGYVYNNPSASAVYLNLPGSGILNQHWYSAQLCGSQTTPTACSPATATVTGTTCTTSSSSAPSGSGLSGFEAITQNGQPIVVTSVAALNADYCGTSNTIYGPTGSYAPPGSPTNPFPCPISNWNPIAKNRVEFKESAYVWVDGEIDENSGAQGQEGQCGGLASIKACSGNSKCINGQTQDVHDMVRTNSVCRHANNGIFLTARSGNGSYNCWSDSSNPFCVQTLQSIKCDTNNQEYVDFTFSANLAILNSGLNAQIGGTGTDVLISGITDTTLQALLGLTACSGSGSSLVCPSAWFQTENETYGATIPVVIPQGGQCAPGTTYSTHATLAGPGNSDGFGVSPGFYHGVNQNNLNYDIGNHNNWNATGSSESLFYSGGGNNFSVDVVMGPATGLTGIFANCQSQYLPVGSIGNVACAVITAINACPAGAYPRAPLTNTECPLLLQAQKNDLMQVQCPSNTAFSTGIPISSANGGGIPNGIGSPIIDLDPNQQWFTYIPTPAGTPTNGVTLPSGYTPITSYGQLPLPLATASCPLEMPHPGLHPGYVFSGDVGSSGVYNGQSYPKSTVTNHITSVGMNGAYVTGQSYETNQVMTNGILAVPGFLTSPITTCTESGTSATCNSALSPPLGSIISVTGVTPSGYDITEGTATGTSPSSFTYTVTSSSLGHGTGGTANGYYETGVPNLPNGIQTCGSAVACGFRFGGLDTYTGPPAPSMTTPTCPGVNMPATNLTGITNYGDPGTLTFYGWSLIGRTLANYPIWSNDSATCTAGSGTYAAKGNSTPGRTSSPNSTVECSASPSGPFNAGCTSTNYFSDSVGFAGAMNTSAYPLNLTNWGINATEYSPIGYALDPSSPYRMRGPLEASDGLDNGVVFPYVANAMARTIRPCPLVTGCPTFYHDGLQYEWLTWSCSGVCTSFTVYEDNNSVLTPSFASSCSAACFAQVYSLAVNSTHSWSVTGNGNISALRALTY